MAVPGALPRRQTWKNNRKRSLYVEEGVAGFIFYRKSKAVKEGEVPVSEQGPAEPEPTVPIQPVLVVNEQEEKKEEEEEEVVGDNDTSPLSDEQLKNLVEVRNFVDQLKKEMGMKGVCSSDSKLEEACSALHKKLKRDIVSGSGTLYVQFLEAMEEEDKLASHPLDTQLIESIRQLQQIIEMCEREVKEWEQLVEVKKSEAQETMKDLENDMGVHLGQLGPEDEVKLASHLSPEHRSWLDAATKDRRDQDWERQTEEALSSVRSHINGELERIRTYCDTVLQLCTEEAHQLGLEVELPTQTPRTLIRALKDTTN